MVSDRSSHTPGSLLRVSITSDPERAARVRQAVERFARRLGFTEADAASVVLATDEAVCNVIRHGYDGAGGQPIEVMLAAIARDRRKGIEVTIEDSARAVDPDQIAGRDLADVRPGGLGTHIINTVMDEVDYRPREPVGMSLRMVKWIPDSPAGDQAADGQAGKG